MTVEQKTSARPAIAVYCGSSVGNRQEYEKAARSLGRALAENGYNLVYGGGSSGLMGIVSDAVLEAGGDVTGIMPFAMSSGCGETNPASEVMDGLVTRRGKLHTIMVDSMHERKVEMAKRSVGFIGLPGGFGTFEEIMEVTTWTQLGIHKKPVVLLNVLSYFEPLRQLVDGGILAGYISPSNKKIISFVDGPILQEEHGDFDWGRTGIQAVETWQGTVIKPLFDWGRGRSEILDAT